MCAKCKEAHDLLTSSGLSEEQAGYVLWEKTCFPMDGEIALRQVKEWLALRAVKLDKEMGR